MINETVEYYLDEMEVFWKYIAERHTIHKKKHIFTDPPPWTEDPILQNYKFTEIFRDLDRGTRFVFEHIYEEVTDKSDIFLNIVVYRIFNKIETFLHHGTLRADQFDRHSFIQTVREAAEDWKVFTNAFVVSGYPCFTGADKIERVSHLFYQVAEIANKYPEFIEDLFGDSMEKAYHRLLSVNGLGPFLAYQIAVDLSYHSECGYGEDDFVIDGPGAKRGIQRLFPEWTIKEFGYEELNFWLRDKQFEFWEDYNIDWKELFSDRPEPRLTVMDLENCLCEISKYFKALLGEGRPRNNYSTADGVVRLTSGRDDAWDKGRRFNKFLKKFV